MSVINLRLGAFAAALALLAASSSGALAQKKYDIGASDTDAVLAYRVEIEATTDNMEPFVTFAD